MFNRIRQRLFPTKKQEQLHEVRNEIEQRYQDRHAELALEHIKRMRPSTEASELYAVANGPGPLDCYWQMTWQYPDGTGFPYNFSIDTSELKQQLANDLNQRAA